MRCGATGALRVAMDYNKGLFRGDRCNGRGVLQIIKKGLGAQ